MHIILASHSRLAEGMKDTVELIMGKQTHLHAISAYIDDSLCFRDQLLEVMKDIAETCLFVTDVLGGSVNNELTEFVRTHPEHRLVSGMNLPFVLDIMVKANSHEESQMDEAIEQSISIGKEGLVFNRFDSTTIEEEDF